MDEILIEEKKYVSSKQAAKMTGYAKDYIGQLCREGRVPARLIGRSWYVLEAAIQDHRFGNPVIEPAKKEKKTVESPSLVSTWESPRYEASSDELLPSVNRTKDTELDAFSDNRENGQNEAQYIQDSWKAWFDRFDHVVDTDISGSAEGTDVSEGIVDGGEPIAQKISEEAKEEEADEEIEEVNIPIHTVSRPLYHPPPEELLPRNVEHLEVRPPSKLTIRRKKGNRGIIMTMQMTGAMLAVVTAAMAVLGSGYFDEYIISSSQARMIAGVALFNR